MKAQILKHTGLTEKQFYAKYKDQKAFDNSKEGKEFKKAQQGVNMNTQGDTNKNGIPDYLEYTPTLGPNQFMQGNNTVGSFASGKVLPQYSGNMFKPTQIPEVNYGMPGQNKFGKPSQDWETPGTIPAGLPQAQSYGMNQYVQENNQAVTGQPTSKDVSGGKGSGIPNAAIASSISSIPGIFNAFDSEKKQKQSLEQQNKLLGLFETLIQSEDRDAPYQKNILDRQENYAQSTNMFYPSQGTGYDILRGVGRDGATIRKAQDGINNFGPDYDLYSDGGYEPLNDSDNDSNKIKQYANGGVTGNPIYGAASGVIGSQFNNNAGYQAGAAVAPYADMVLPGSGLALQMLGGGLDQAFGDAGKIKKLTDSNAGTQERILNNSMWKNMGQFGGVRQEGGYMNPEYNPQLITMFGDHDSEDFADYAHKYRSGGHLKDDEYTPVSNRGLQTYAEGGELKTHWGGEVEPVSYNPYSEGEGLTYNAYGNSHFQKDEQGRTGIGLSIMKDGGDMGDGPDVEIETNEPISMTGDGAVVYGNLNVNEDLLKDFQLPEKYAKQKVKNVVNKMIVPLEQKYTAQLEKMVTDDSFNNSKFKALGDKTREIKKIGLNMKLKKLAQDKENLAAYQDHVHKTTDFLTNLLGKEVSQEKFAKNGEVSHTLAKGEISQDTAQAGKRLKFKSDKEAIAAGFTKTPKGWVKTKKGLTNAPTQKRSAEALGYIPEGQHADVASGLYGGVTPEQFNAYKEKNKWYDWSKFDPKNPIDVKNYGKAFNAKAKEVGSQASITPDDYFGQQYYSANLNENQEVTPAVDAEEQADVVPEDYEPIEDKKGFPLGATLASLAKGFYPAFNTPLGNQINPELYALANNRVKGFAVNKTYDMLKTPAKYSADKDRNSILSQAREAVKNAGNNPAAQSAIMASVADAMNQVGSKEQEINQQGYQGVYNDNIATVNQNRNRNAALDMDAQLKMLQAESNTDARTLSALTSLYGKEAANKRENIEYNVGMAEHPDFTFGPDGRIIKLPRYIDFDTSGKNATASSSKKQTAPEGFEYLYDSSGNVKTMKSKKEDNARDGKTIKKKNINGNIVKAFKNL